MSLFLAYHDKTRAVVASDDRAISFLDGEPIPCASRVPKFQIVGASLIVAILGISELATRLHHGIARAVRDNPEMRCSDVAEMLSVFSQKAFEARTSDAPLGFDMLESAVIGFDPLENRIRSFGASSSDNFQLVETTSDPWNRIFALGFYDRGDLGVLQSLTERMKQANTKQFPWIAASLRSSIDELHAKHTKEIGQASFFAALNHKGVVDLPVDFPKLPEEEMILHLVTQDKSEALSNTDLGRFFLGTILTPVSASAQPTIGNGDGGVGSQLGMLMILRMASSVTNGEGGSGLLGNGSVANLANITDGDSGTYGTLTVTGNGAGNEAIVLVSGVAGVQPQNVSSMTLQIVISNPTNNLSPAGPFATFTISYSVNGPGGPFNTIVSNVPPTTQALQQISVPLPRSTNPNQVCVLVGATSFSSQTSGQCVVQVNDVWVEMIAE